MGGPYTRLPGLSSPSFCSEISCWLCCVLALTHARSDTGCSVIATPCAMLNGNLLRIGRAQEASGGCLAIQQSVASGLLGRNPSFLGGDHRTPVFMLSAAELTFCGVTEVPGEPAPPAKAVFTRLPKPPHTNMSPGSMALQPTKPQQDLPMFQTPGATLVQSSQRWTPGCAGKEENVEEKRAHHSLQLLVAEVLRFRPHVKIKQRAPGHPANVFHHVACRRPETLPGSIRMSYIYTCQVEIPIPPLCGTPLSTGRRVGNSCWEYCYIWGWFVPSRTQLEIIDRMIRSLRQTMLLSRKQQHRRENKLKQVREELGSARIAFASQMDRLRQRKTNGEGKWLPIAQIFQALGGGGGWVQALFRSLGAVSPF